MSDFNCVVVCGPTASGKTRLAVAIANRFDGEIISADSRQVYRDMDIGTGKDLHEYTTGSVTIPVHCVDIKDPSEVYTVYHFKQDFFRIFGEITSRKHLPVMAGGSGLYIESVLRNFDIPSIPENVPFREQKMQLEKDVLISELLRLSPEIHSKTDLSSKKRVVRAIEVATHVRQHPVMGNVTIPLRPIVICTRWERTILYRRIDTRLQERLQQGLIDEVKRLAESGVARERLMQFGMEYKHAMRFIAGEIAYSDMVNELQRDIHQLAKRQQTWFRGMERRGIITHWIDNCDTCSAIDLIENLLNRT